KSILAEESKAGGLIEARPDLDTLDKIWKFYKEDFRVDQSLPPQTAFNLISRATNVTGNMLEFLADRNHLGLGKRIGARIAMLGPIFWKMTAVVFALRARVRKFFGRSS